MKQFGTARFWVGFTLTVISSSLLAYGIAVWSVNTFPPLSADEAAPSSTTRPLSDRIPPGPEVYDSISPIKN